MNEEYLKRFRKQPNSVFVKKIHTRLERKERIQAIKRYAVRSALALAFLFGVLMTFSSTVRADVISLIVKIGGLHFEVTSQNPHNPYLPERELVPEYLSWEEAGSRFLSPLQLPVYVPEGYEREANTHLYIWGDGTPTLEVFWRKKGGQSPMIGLFIAQCRDDAPGCGFRVGEEALEEIALNGKPAALIRGAWDSETRQYDLSAAIKVMWRYDEDTFYNLWSFDQNLADELIKMAESVP
jgi:hypothetical protein